ncbi:MAG: peptidylprolyl isomerase [Candidatus Paceibacterota bacterium]|jgi:peptidylprolyl isomerase
MNKISLYAVIVAFVVTGVVGFLLVKNNSSDKVLINGKGEVVIDKKISPQAGDNQNINSPDNKTATSTKKVAPKYMKATLQTNKGDIVIEFNSGGTPNTVANFIKLAQAGFYDGTKFHRVIKGFMNQGGDPFSKDDTQMARWGTGGPGYSFNDEITAENKNNTGTISMANSGPNTNGSQFFINVADNNSLDPKHTVFGKVVKGMDVVMAINSTPTDSNDRPIDSVIIEKVNLE